MISASTQALLTMCQYLSNCQNTYKLAPTVVFEALQYNNYLLLTLFSLMFLLLVSLDFFFFFCSLFLALAICGGVVFCWRPCVRKGTKCNTSCCLRFTHLLNKNKWEYNHFDRPVYSHGYIISMRVGRRSITWFTVGFFKKICCQEQRFSCKECLGFRQNCKLCFAFT